MHDDGKATGPAEEQLAIAEDAGAKSSVAACALSAQPPASAPLTDAAGVAGAEGVTGHSTLEPSPRPRKRSKPRPRCDVASCKKFRTLQQCMCGASYCISHYTPALHQCTRVSEHGSKQALENTMLGAQFEKLEKI